MESFGNGIQLDLLDRQLAANLRGDFEEGWRLSQLLLEERPDDKRAAFNRGWHYMYHGDLQKGFACFESGREIGVFGSKLPEALQYLPRWTGAEDIYSKSVLLYSEGGLGDEILNVRFAHELTLRGARVTVACQPALVSVFARVAGVERVVPITSAHTFHFDYYVPAMSAALPLGVTFETLRGDAYITPHETSLASWRQRISGPGLKVGIRWSGNPRFEHEQHRRFPAEPLIGLSNIPGITVYSLQRDDDLRDLPPSVIDIGPELQTWEDTLAALSLMDIVITSDTSINHASGALGKETWTILPILPYYPWALPGNTTPWYKNTTLFRQETFGNWDAPLANVRSKLLGRIGDTVTVQSFATQVTSASAPLFVPPAPPLQQSSAPSRNTFVVPGLSIAPKPTVSTTLRSVSSTTSTLHFVAGLPRCGSTALISLLAQNPDIFGAPISGLSGMFGGVHANWDKSEFHVEMPNEDAKKRVLRAILDSYHQTDRRIILDKDRQWVTYIGILEHVLERPVKMIIPVRPLAEILSSFEVLRRRTPLIATSADQALGPSSTIATRASYFMGPEGAVGRAYTGMKDAVTEGYLDRMLFVDYNKLTLAPKTQLRRIYDFLEVPYFEHNTERVEQIAFGNSAVHKFMGLHDIRSVFKKESISAREVLGGDVVGQYDGPEPWAMWT